MSAEPFFMSDQLMIEILWSVLVMIGLGVFGALGSAALLALACCVKERPSRPDDDVRPRGGAARVLGNRVDAPEALHAREVRNL